MFPRQLGYEFAVLAATCIVAIFLFPVACGPYAAVHGPVTALLSLRIKVKLWLGMALAALPWLEALRSDRFGAWGDFQKTVSFSPCIDPCDATVLRC